MAIIKSILKKGGAGASAWRGGAGASAAKGGAGAGGSCKWCAQGECWSHGQVSKGNGKGKGAKGGGNFGAGIVCHKCGKPGHKSPDCFQGQKGGGNFGAGIVCHNCGKPGHKSPDCFQGQKGGGNFGAGIVCHNCGKPGHKSPDCFQGQKGQKGWGKGGNKGGGKGSLLRSFATEVKVWVGGLPADSTGKDNNMALKEHMAQAGNCKFAEISKKGSGGAAFATAEEATNAIAMLNGTEFAGVAIEVDVWTKKEKE